MNLLICNCFDIRFWEFYFCFDSRSKTRCIRRTDTKPVIVSAHPVCVFAQDAAVTRPATGSSCGCGSDARYTRSRQAPLEFVVRFFFRSPTDRFIFFSCKMLYFRPHTCVPRTPRYRVRSLNDHAHHGPASRNQIIKRNENSKITFLSRRMSTLHET